MYVILASREQTRVLDSFSTNKAHYGKCTYFHFKTLVSQAIIHPYNRRAAMTPDIAQDGWFNAGGEQSAV